MAESNKVTGWPYGIAVFYGIFVLLLLIFVLYTMFNNIDLVSDEYYAEDLAYQQQIDRQTRSKNLKTGLNWVYNEPSKQVKLIFPSNFSPDKISGKIIFFRPSDAKLDRTVRIAPDKSGNQTVDVSFLKTGIWRIKIFWNVVSTDYYEEGIIHINADANI